MEKPLAVSLCVLALVAIARGLPHAVDQNQYPSYQIPEEQQPWYNDQQVNVEQRSRGFPDFGALDESQQVPDQSGYQETDNGQITVDQQDQNIQPYHYDRPNLEGYPSNEHGQFLTVTCNEPGKVCVPKSSCVDGYVYSSQVIQQTSQECPLGKSVCCIVKEDIPQEQEPIEGDFGSSNQQNVHVQRPTEEQELQHSGNNDILSVTRLPPVSENGVPTHLQLGCAAALLCVEERFCTADGMVSNTPVIFTEKQLFRRVPLSDCRNPDSGVVGKCCRDPNYVDPWPAGNLPANYTGGFDEQGFPTFLNIAKVRPPKKPSTGVKTSPRPTKTSPRPNIHVPQQQLVPQQHIVPQPHVIPQVVQQPHEIPQVVQQPHEIPQVVQQPHETPQVVQQPHEIPQVVQQPHVFPQVVQQPHVFPQVVQQPHEIPQVVQQPHLIPQVVPQPHLIPQVVPQPHVIPQVVHQPHVIPQVVPQQQVTERPHFVVSEAPTHEFSQSTNSFPHVTVSSTVRPVSTVPFAPAVPQIPSFGYQPHVPRPFSKNTYDSASSDKKNVIAVPEFSKNQCGVKNNIPRPNGLNDAETAFGEIPWQAMVLSNEKRKLLCSGVLVKPDMVLTAAHCTNGFQADQVSVKFGEWKLGYELKHEEPLPFEIVNVSQIIPHPHYNGLPSRDMVALMLEHPASLNVHINLLCVPETAPIPTTRTHCIVTGWGKEVLEGNLAGAIMRVVDVDVLPQDACEQRLQDAATPVNINGGAICVKAQRQNNNMCQVDVGGPLACDRGDGRYDLVGIYSQDTGCLPTNQVAVFAPFEPAIMKTPSVILPPRVETHVTITPHIVPQNTQHSVQTQEPYDYRKSNLPPNSNQYLPPRS